LLLVACGGADEARVSEILESGEHALPVELVSFEGTRDGERTAVVAVFEGSAQARLEMRFALHYDPVPQLDGGTWTYSGPTGRAEGVVRAESVRFVGGQGEGASVGGEYLLEENGISRFRVHLPLRGVESSWTP
jgi:hypothetical protein